MPAQPVTSLNQRLRGSFLSSPPRSVTAVSAAPQVPASDIPVSAPSLPAQPAMPTPAVASSPTGSGVTQSSPVSQADALTSLEQAIAEAERLNKAQAVAQPAPAPETVAPTPAIPQSSQPNQPLETLVAAEPAPVSPIQPPLNPTSPNPSLNPAMPVGGGRKEAFEGYSAPDLSNIDVGSSVQYVEQEPNPEIPPEVESYLKEVEQNVDQAPQEIVIADGNLISPNDHVYPSQPVVVLPITPEVEEQGMKKNPTFSIRWLVEWSRKIMKAFVGKVIYREVQ